jgi:HSP20 family protein
MIRVNSSTEESSVAHIVRTNPLGDLNRFDPFRDIEDFFGSRKLRSLLRDLPEAPELKIDVSEDETAYHVKAEIPGARKEDIRVAVDGNGVSITAEVKREKEEKKGETVLRSERYYGKQSRTFTLMHDIDQSKAEAKYEDGILALTLPKKAGATTNELKVQ